MGDDRQVVEGIIYRYRSGIPWRDLPAWFVPWQTVWKRHRRFSSGGTWDPILATLLAWADAAQEIDFTLSVDWTINRAHRHATNLPREPTIDPRSVSGATSETPTPLGPAEVDASARMVAGLAGHTGGWVESRRFYDSGRSGRS